MTKPESFILTSDFATLKNDSNVTVSVTVPSSVVIPGSVTAVGQYVEYHQDSTSGKQGAISRIQISSSGDSNRIYPARTVSWERLGTVGGVGGFSYSVFAFTYRVNPTTVRCMAYIMNPYSTPLTTAAGETITFYVATFLPPFA